MFLATTRGAVLRGTATTDTLGDEYDDNATPAPGYADLPLALTERSRRVQDPASGVWVTVRYYTGRLPGNVVLLDGDRIRDNRTRRVYAINEDEATPRGISGQSSLTLDLTLVNG